MNEKANQIVEEVNRVIVGKEDVVRKVWMTILSEGHVLLEDVPGVGKTTMALAFSRVLGLDYRRIQFTPDVMPSDLTGFYYYNKKQDEFEYREGAVMTNLLLADEINRTSSRTQSALLEAMEERQVTVDGNTHPLKDPFFVIATQNPVGSAGTQMLPESQLDRFMVMLSVGYPSVESEVRMMRERGGRNPLDQVRQMLTKDELIAMQREAASVDVSPLIYQYIAYLAGATRNHELIRLGVSPRGSLALARMARANAYLDGRDYVVPEDVQEVLPDVFRHRLLLKSSVRLSERTADSILEDILSKIPVPDQKTLSHRKHRGEIGERR